jgi:hypothetical protein
MRAIVVYESMYGNTHTIAEAVAEGLGRSTADVSVVPVGRATAELMQSADVVVVGAPTPGDGLSRPSTRASAVEAAGKPETQLTLDADAHGLGVRDWLAVIGPSTALAAAFDTRVSGPSAFTGRASHAIDRHLRRHGFSRIMPPESFLVDKQNHLLPGEADRAREWGSALAATPLVADA